MPPHGLLIDMLVALGAALFVLLVSRPLRLPPILGFMVTGMLVGPHGFGGVSEAHEVEALAEIGVTLLLFVIGLEFSLERLKEFRRAFFLGGPLQVAATAGIAYLLLMRTLTTGQAILAGCMLALSSTAMVFRLLADSAGFASPHGRLKTGILLFQDFAMVPMIAIVPALAGGDEGGLRALPSLLAGAGAAVAAFVAARYLMPRALSLVAHSGVNELVVIGAVFLCLGSAAATAALGLSPALGAFLAGILVSESEYSHRITAEILPFRDLFNSLFFVSIGMLLDVRFVAGNPMLVVGLSAGVLLVKALIAGGVVLVLRFPVRIAIMVGLGLSQIGEFSFVIADLAHELHLLGDFEYQAFLAVAVVTLCLTPFLVALAPAAGARLGSLAPGRLAGAPGGTAAAPEAGAAAEPAPGHEALEGHVLIVGHGLNGRNLARVLREVGLRYAIVELDGNIVRRARKAGETNILYGDATRVETLEHCGVRRAAIVVFAIADPDAARRGVTLVRLMNPSATILVRTLLVNQVDELLRLGADEVIPEEFETSIALFSRVLRRMHVPVNVIRNQEKLLRSEAYEFLRTADAGSTRMMARVSSLMAAGTTETFLVEEDSTAAGRTIQQTGLREKTGVTIIAVVRDGTPTVSPPPDLTIAAGDVLVLVGSHQALERAYEELGGGSG